jgi:hypothetical protein
VAVHATLALPSLFSRKANSSEAYTFFEQHQKGGATQGLVIDVGGCTTLVSLVMRRARERSEYGVWSELLRAGIAPYDDTLRAACRRELRNRGFAEKTRYLIINYRESGHMGGAHPELDTGFANLEPLAEIARELGYTPVFMGEQPVDAPGRPNLLNYWLWECCKGKGRAAEAALLRVLHEDYDVRVVAMRSGVTDLVAFLGIPLISIDYDAYTTEQRKERRSERFGYDYLAKDMAVDHTWVRGIKLEAAFLRSYGRVFFREDRLEEPAEKVQKLLLEKLEWQQKKQHKMGWLDSQRKEDGSLPYWLHDTEAAIKKKQAKPIQIKKKPKPWSGRFSRNDLRELRDGIRMYFGGGPGVRHSSHPLHPENTSSDPERGRMTWVDHRAARDAMADFNLLHALGPMAADIDDNMVRNLLDSRQGQTVAVVWNIERLGYMFRDESMIVDAGDRALYNFKQAAAGTVQLVLNTHANKPLPRNAVELAAFRKVSHYIAVELHKRRGAGQIEVAFSDSLMATSPVLVKQLATAFSR